MWVVVEILRASYLFSPVLPQTRFADHRHSWFLVPNSWFLFPYQIFTLGNRFASVWGRKQAATKESM